MAQATMAQQVGQQNLKRETVKAGLMKERQTGEKK